MIELQTIATLLSFNDSDMLHHVVDGLMTSPQLLAALKAKPRFEKQIRDQLGRWCHNLNQLVQHQNAPPELELEFRLYQQMQGLPADQFCAREANWLAELEKFSPFHADASTLVQQLQESNQSLRKQLILRHWRDHLVNRIMAMEMELAEQERERMLKELEERLAIAEEVEATLHMQQPGKLWDLSATRLLQGDRQRLQHYAKFLARNTELQKIAAELGRAARDESEQRSQLHQQMHTQMRDEPQDRMPDDLVGVHQSNDLQHLLPSETLLLTSTELETLFFKQLAERRLLNYHFMGQAKKPETVETDTYVQEQAIQQKGPFIVCIDTSGSMSGYPEETAKALCFALLQIALAEERACIVQLFATEVVSYELTGPDGLKEALNFLGCSFKGGTDLEPCFQQMLKRMQTQHYRNADAIVLSDFIAQRLPGELLEQVNDIKTAGNRFNAVCLSRHGKPALMKIFDAVWRFDTGLGGRLLRRLR